MAGQGLGPRVSGRERLGTLKAKIKGDFFQIKKLGSSVDGEVRKANGRAAQLKTQGHRYMADGEPFKDALDIFEKAIKGEKIHPDYEEKIEREILTTGDRRNDALQHLISYNRRRWVANRNDGQTRLKAAREWENFAKQIRQAYDEVVAEVKTYA